MPVCVEGQPCDGPAKSFPLVFWRNGKVAGRTTTSQTGAYRIRLAPGLIAERPGGLAERVFVAAKLHSVVRRNAAP